MVGLLQDDDAASGTREIGGGGQTVVSRADHDVVVESNCGAHRSKVLRSTGTAEAWRENSRQRRMRATNGVESFIDASTALE